MNKFNKYSADKHIADKHIADKHIADKHIADKNSSNISGNQSERKNVLGIKSSHSNSKNILSILFDEVNCSEERFKALKKKLHTKHYYHLMVKQNSSYEVFNRNT